MLVVRSFDLREAEALPGAGQGVVELDQHLAEVTGEAVGKIVLIAAERFEGGAEIRIFGANLSDIATNLELRLLLESRLLRGAAENMSAQDFTELRALADEFEQAFERGDRITQPYGAACHHHRAARRNQTREGAKKVALSVALDARQSDDLAGRG